jgi:hypothetical protein
MTRFLRSGRCPHFVEQVLGAPERCGFEALYEFSERSIQVHGTFFSSALLPQEVCETLG